MRLDGEALVARHRSGGENAPQAAIDVGSDTVPLDADEQMEWQLVIATELAATQKPAGADVDRLRRGPVDEFPASPPASGLGADVAAGPTERGYGRKRGTFPGNVGLHIRAERGLRNAQEGHPDCGNSDVSHSDLFHLTRTRITVAGREPNDVPVGQHLAEIRAAFS